MVLVVWCGCVMVVVVVYLRTRHLIFTLSVHDYSLHHAGRGGGPPTDNKKVQRLVFQAPGI